MTRFVAMIGGMVSRGEEVEAGGRGGVPQKSPAGAEEGVGVANEEGDRVGEPQESFPVAEEGVGVLSEEEEEVTEEQAAYRPHIPGRILYIYR